MLNQFKKLDKGNMFKSIQDFPNQIKNSIELMSKKHFNTKRNINNILICGMGGSAIGADIVKDIIIDELLIPIVVNRNYSFPKWVNKSTLIILSSFSGNTEEVLSCMQECTNNKLNPIIISTGGKLINEAKTNGFEFVQFYDDALQPRAALGYSVSILLLLLNKFMLINDNIISDLDYCAIELAKYGKEIQSTELAIKLAKEISDFYPIIYVSDEIQSVGFRFRCQLAENSKILSSHLMFPEQNHNEIEGFIQTKIDKLIIFWLDVLISNKKILKRFEITQKILLKNNIKHIKLSDYLSLNNDSKLIGIFKQIHFLDWVSYYAGLLNDIDPSEIPNIKMVKKNL